MNQPVRFSVLGSGSDANAYCFAAGNEVLLIDNGFSCREVLRRCSLAGVNPGKLAGILVTHDHRDHIQGVRTLAKKMSIPVYLPAALAGNISWLNEVPKTVLLEPGTEIDVGRFRVMPFETFHDSPGSVGYSLFAGGKRLTVITDTGRTDAYMTELALASDVLFLESNYCPEMLLNGSYPEFLKRRIISDAGHLSNHDACAFLKELDVRRRRVYLCHLSANNNTPLRVQKALETSGLHQGTRCIVCSRGELYNGQI